MKRDLNLVRLILLKIEETAPGQSVFHLTFEGFDPDIIAEHVEILHEAGLIEAILSRSMNNLGVLVISNYDIRRLTWEGHDFVANSRNKNIWEQFQLTVKEKGGDISFSVAKQLLTKLAINQFGL
jgi:hypothetical protein